MLLNSDTFRVFTGLVKELKLLTPSKKTFPMKRVTSFTFAPRTVMIQKDAR